MFAKVCRGGGVPGGGKGATESVTLLKKPAKRRNRADIWIRQRPYQVRQPVASWASVRIAKNKNVISLLGLLHGCAKVIHFFAASFGTSGDYDVSLALAGSRQFVENLAGRVLAAGHGEKNVVIGIIKRRERGQILLEPRLHAFYGTNQGNARRVKASVAANPPLRHAQPAQPVPQIVEPLQDLLHNEEVEECKHGWPLAKRAARSISDKTGRTAVRGRN